MIRTLNELYLQTIGVQRPAIMKYRRGDRWMELSVPEFRDTVRHLSAGLRQLGVKPEDRVAILSENRYEWGISDFAILTANAVTVPIYPTLTAKQIEFILQNSEAVALIASDQQQMDKVLQIRAGCPALRSLITYASAGSSDVLTLESVIKRGQAKDDRAAFEQQLAQRKPDDVATIVYTSGTTGTPKGAMLTHGNIASNIVASCEVVDFRSASQALSVLPLSHIFERMVDFAYLYAGACIAYCEDHTKLVQYLEEVKPEVVALVPRIFEKFHARVMDKVSQKSETKQKIFRWAMKVAEERLPYRVEDRTPPPMLALKVWVAGKLVYRDILARLGGRIRFVMSGAAPLSPKLTAFFIGIGLEIYEGYGLTETSPVITVNGPGRRKLGTVGKPIPGVEVKIAPDGEILTRGPHVMKGYFKNPQATAEAIDQDGWFHTGDIGQLDQDGFLKITDRKKEIIINAYGKNIAPQYVEEILKGSPYIATPVVIGDRRNFISALIVPNFDRLEREMGNRPRQSLVDDPRVREIFQREIDKLNSELAHFEQVRCFTILPQDFSIETGELTPSMKVKRRVVDEKYAPQIEAMYRSPLPGSGPLPERGEGGARERAG